MRGRDVGQVLLAAALGGSAATSSAPAAAYSCAPLREIVPLDGAIFPAEGQILDICYYGAADGKPRPDLTCEKPVLQDSAGRSIELIEQRRVSTDQATRVTTAYRPASTLLPGRYRITSAYYGLHVSHAFSVVDGTGAPPSLPVLSGLYFEMGTVAGSAAVLGFEPFDGTLAVERDGRVQDPLEGLDMSGYFVSAMSADPAEIRAPSADPREFRLAREICQTNFRELDYGVSTTLRFGVLAASGSFSGWTDPLLVTFPTREEVEAEYAAATAAERERWEQAPTATPPGWCSLSAAKRRPLPPGGTLLPLAALFAGTWLRRRSR